MSVALVADAHLGGEGGGPEPLLEQLETLPGLGCQRLVLVGDLFQAWVGLPGFQTDEIRVVVAAIGDLRRKGVPVDYVEGNRDFFLDTYHSLFDRLAPELEVVVGERKYLILHGDGVDPSDRQYLFWRSLSKSRLTRVVAGALPAPLARWLMSRTERRLARTNFRHKIRIPEEAIRRLGDARLTQEHYGLILGHYHEERLLATEKGPIWLLPATEET